MADRIAVMAAGRVQQVGTPTEIYEQPRNCFVADFIGDSNLIEARIVEMNDSVIRVRLPTEDMIDAVIASSDKEIAKPEYPGLVLLRPESISIEPQSTGDSSASSSSETTSDRLQGVVKDTVYLGTDRQYVVAIGDKLQIHVRQQNPGSAAHVIKPGTAVSIKLAEHAARFLPE